MESEGIGEAGCVNPKHPLLSLPPGERAAVFYHLADDAKRTVVAVIKDSISQNEMCAFVSNSPISRLKNDLRDFGLNPDRTPSLVVISLGKTHIEGYSDQSITEQMRTFARQARALGYAGSRLIMDVPEALSMQIPSDQTWMELDKVREELGMTVVCLFDLTAHSPEFLIKTLASYPNIIVDGVLSRNFYYLPSMEAGRFDPKQEIYQLMDHIRVEQRYHRSEEVERSKLMEVNRELNEEVLRRKLLEFALLRAENNLHIMLDTMDDVVFMVDRELRVTMGNLAFLRFLRENDFDTAFEGKDLFEIFPDAPHENRSLFEEVFRFGYATVVDETYNLQRGPHPQYAEVRRIPVKIGEKVENIVVIIRNRPAKENVLRGMWDYAEMLKIEVADPEGFMKGTMDSCPHPIIVTDKDGRIYDCNSALSRKFGYSKDEMLELGNTSSIIHPADQVGEMRRRTNDNGRINLPAMIQHKDGSHVRVDLFVCNAKDEERIITIMHPTV